MKERLLATFLRVRALLDREEGQAAVEYGVLVALIIALATVVGHALRVAGAKPEMALRYE